MNEVVSTAATAATETSEHAQDGSGREGPEMLLLATYRLLPDADTATLSELWSAMHALATSDPSFGFLGYAGFTADDGTRLVIYRFASLEGLKRFRSHPDHITVQRRGGEFFEWLRNEICAVVAVHPWTPARS